MILAILQMPSKDDSFARAAAATGMSQSDVRLRLAGTLPRVLMMDADSGRLCAAQADLNRSGFVTAVCDPLVIPGDEDRIVARRIEFGSGELVAIQGVGAETPHHIAASAIALVQRGVRSSVQTQKSTATTRQFAAGRALMTGGLMVTKKVEKTTTQTSQAFDPFVTIQRNDGGPDVMLYEKRMDFRFLGPDMQASSRGNLDKTLAKLRAFAPSAPLDERLSRPGFVTGLLSGPADPLDLALYLVRLLHLGR